MYDKYFVEIFVWHHVILWLYQTLFRQPYGTCNILITCVYNSFVCLWGRILQFSNFISQWNILNVQIIFCFKNHQRVFVHLKNYNILWWINKDPRRISEPNVLDTAEWLKKKKSLSMGTWPVIHQRHSLWIWQRTPRPYYWIWFIHRSCTKIIQ